MQLQRICKESILKRKFVCPPITEYNVLLLQNSTFAQNRSYLALRRAIFPRVGGGWSAEDGKIDWSCAGTGVL